MSLILIRPKTPDTSRSGIVSIQYPINIGYLVSYLRGNSINCLVKDYEVENFSESEFIAFIKKTKPALVGFSCMTPHILHAAQMAGILKANFPEIKTVAGGVHPSAIPEQTLKEFPQFDIVVVGEGEQTMVELYKRVASSRSIDDVNGLVFKSNSQIKVNPRRAVIEDLDDLPFPEREIINIDYYKRSHVSRGFSRKVMRIAEIMVSRGCPYSCIFCASKIVHLNGVRLRDPGKIIAEIQELVEKYKIEHLSFLDDNFAIRKDILWPVCHYMKTKKLTFDCFTRVNDVNEEKIRIMVDGGCEKISFGIESGSPKVLKLLKKGITLPQIKEAFKLCRKIGLPKIEGTFMIGAHPDETVEDIEMTRRLIFELNPDILGLFIAIPYPGTELNQILKEREFLVKENWEEFKLFFGNPSWKASSVPNEVLQKILNNIAWSYYLNPLFLIKSFLKIKNVKELKYWVSITISLVKTRFSSR